MARIGVVQSGFYSHVEAIKRVSRALERQGHCMIPLEPSEEADLPVSAPAHNHRPALQRISQTAPIAAGLAEIAERYSEELIEALMANDLDLVIHDVMASWGRVAADFCGIPRIVNQLGDRALTLGQVASAAVIDQPLILAAAQDLDLAPKAAETPNGLRPIAFGLLLTLLLLAGGGVAAWVFHDRVAAAIHEWRSPILRFPSPTLGRGRR